MKPLTTAELKSITNLNATFGQPTQVVKSHAQLQRYQLLLAQYGKLIAAGDKVGAIRIACKIERMGLSANPENILTMVPYAE